MTTERPAGDDALLAEAFASLPEPELPGGLRQRLEAIPKRGNVRRFRVRSWRVSTLGWAAAAALGLFIGSRSVEQESATSEGAASAEDTRVSSAETPANDEDETLALAVGSFVEFEEEP